MKTVEMELPENWICPLEYGPDSYGDWDADEIRQFERFQDDMVREYGACWPVSYGEDDGNFRRYHDATSYGVLACNVVTVTFQIVGK